MSLKLYVWEDVLVDWSPGAMWALAESVDQAREKILETCGHVVMEDLAKDPQLVTEPRGFVVWGGG